MQGDDDDSDGGESMQGGDDDSDVVRACRGVMMILMW